MTIGNLSDKKSIRSFVLRNSRLNDKQEYLYKKLMSLWQISYTKQYVDLCKIFSNNNPIILDIGFGMGSATAQIAKIFPNYNFIAVDVYILGVINLLKLIESHAINNIRIIHYDIIDVVSNMLEENSLYGVHIFFPDPWPKKKHHKRRLIQESFINKLNKILITGGYIHIATDWEDYALSILNILTDNKYLVNEFKGFAPRPSYRSVTKFELKGKEKGHKIWDIIFKKK